MILTCRDTNLINFRSDCEIKSAEYATNVETDFYDTSFSLISHAEGGFLNIFSLRVINDRLLRV